MILSLHAVSKRYGRTRALDKVSLEIAPGQIVAVLGANGAGKSTLLRCLSTLAGVDEGQIRCDEQLLTRDRLDIRRRMMFLPDFPSLFLDRTVLRNIAITLQMFGVVRPGIEQSVLQLLREFELLPLATVKVGLLSRGQAYKVGLAALIAVSPEVWLLDEPFASGMDPMGINAFKAYAKRAVQAGATVIYSTQLLDVAERWADRICIIHHGEVRAFDTMDNLRGQAADKEAVLENLFLALRESKS